MKPKLCFIISNYDPNSSSHYFHLYELLSHISSQVDIFLFAESGKSPINITGIKKYYVQKHHSLIGRMFERLLVFGYIYLQGYRKFYCHYADLSTILTSLLTKTFGGTTYKWHCVQEHFYQKPLQLQFLGEKISRELPFYLAIKLTDFLVTSSGEMKTYYQNTYSIGTNKILVIPNYINVKRFHPVEQAKKKKIKKSLHLPSGRIILYIHHLSARKGADRLLSYAQKIKRTYPQYFILAVGSGPMYLDLKNQIKKLKLEKYLHLWGAVSNHDLPKFYQAADVFMMPSRIEEFARVQLEAMASGLPIVATKTLATESMLSLKQQSLVVSQSDYRKISEVIDNLIKSRSVYQNMVHEGLNQVQQFSLSVVAKTFLHNIVGIKS